MVERPLTDSDIFLELLTRLAMVGFGLHNFGTAWSSRGDHQRFLHLDVGVRRLIF